MTTPEDLAVVALSAATEAAALVAEGFRRRPAARSKGHADLVTEYDLASERLLRERLAAATPGVPVVAEEEGGSAGDGLVWYCDPLDGTMNFVHGHPFWCVSVGAADRAGPVAGAVVAPLLDLYWTGYRGGEGRRNGERCSVSDTRELAEALVSTGFRPGLRSPVDYELETFARVKKHIAGVRRCGSAAIDLCFVADGTYDAYWERQLSAWDIAAGVAIVLSSGGLVSAPGGGACRIEDGQLLASNGHLHASLLPLVQ